MYGSFKEWAEQQLRRHTPKKPLDRDGRPRKLVFEAPREIFTLGCGCLDRITWQEDRHRVVLHFDGSVTHGCGLHATREVHRWGCGKTLLTIRRY